MKDAIVLIVLNCSSQEKFDLSSKKSTGFQHENLEELKTLVCIGIICNRTQHTLCISLSDRINKLRHYQLQSYIDSYVSRNKQNPYESISVYFKWLWIGWLRLFKEVHMIFHFLHILGAASLRSKIR